MASTSDNTPGLQTQARTTWIHWACLAGAAAILVWFRLHAFDLPLETDECNYAYIAGRLLAGDLLYVDVWDHQPFGVFALFAGVIAIFGDSPEVFRWLAMGFSLLSLVLIYAIVRVCGGRGAALAGAFMFAIVSSDPGTAGEGCNREIYMNALILSAWYLALRPTRSPRAMVTASGCALALGSTIKTIVAVHWVFLGVWIVLTAWRSATGERRTRSMVTSLALFAVGPAILWLAALGYFAATKRLAEFVDAVFLFNLSYSGQSAGFLARFAGFFTPEKHPFIFDSAWPLWVGGAVGVAWLTVEIVVRGVAHLFRDGGRDDETRINPPRLKGLSVDPVAPPRVGGAERGGATHKGVRYNLERRVPLKRQHLKTCAPRDV